jgi:ubiquinone/menaquinone biosynthesis C-methylase UbiE
MADFEKLYYESDAFWKGSMVQDELNQIRIATTERLIPSEVKSLVDVGCGNGVFANYLLQVRPEINIMAVDRSESALKYVSTNKTIGDIADLPLESNSYDCVTCLQVLEHIPVNNYRKALSELARVSSQYLIASVPYNEKVEKNFTQCPQCRSIFNGDLHLRTFTDKDMATLFSEYGFELVEQKNVVKTRRYVGIEAYSKLRNTLKKQPVLFHSPICPVCGYENKQFGTGSHDAQVAAAAHATRVNSPIGLIKQFWPKKEVPGYWVIALYKRK